MYALLICGIFCLEILLSFLLNKSSISILTRKTSLTVKLSLLAGILYWVRLFIVAKVSDWDIGLMGASILGDTFGDYLVARRKPKRKKVSRKKTPFTSA